MHTSRTTAGSCPLIKSTLMSGKIFLPSRGGRHGTPNSVAVSNRTILFAIEKHKYHPRGEIVIIQTSGESRNRQHDFENAFTGNGCFKVHTSLLYRNFPARLKNHLFCKFFPHRLMFSRLFADGFSVFREGAGTRSSIGGAAFARRQSVEPAFLLFASLQEELPCFPGGNNSDASFLVG